MGRPDAVLVCQPKQGRSRRGRAHKGAMVRHPAGGTEPTMTRTRCGKDATLPGWWSAWGVPREVAASYEAALCRTCW